MPAMPHPMPPESTDHRRALERLAAGDAAALDAVYRDCAGPVYRYLLAMCGDAGAAADGLHDAFLALVDRPGGYDPARGTLGAYLAGIARHALLARWRDPMFQAAPLPDDDDAPGSIWASDATDPLATVVAGADVARLRAALGGLPWAFREAVVLVDLQERDYRDAAAIAGVPLNTLRTRLLRGRRRLAQLLGAGEGEAR